MSERILAFETATDVCSVAVADGTAILSVVEVLRPRSHAEQLTPAVAEALRLAGINARDLAAVAVSAGPGSYTGLRIGTSAAKGIAYATDAVLIAVPTMLAMATSVAAFARPGDVLVPVLRSRRDEVYIGAYRVSDDGTPQQIREDLAVGVGELDAVLAEMRGSSMWFLGEGADQVKSTGVAPRDARFFGRVRPSARWIVPEAAERFRNGRHESLADFEPFYLKDFIARKSGPIFDRLSEKLGKQS